MIKVKLSKNNILIKGHSLYDEYGKDIVCASVSSVVLCTVNGIFSIDDSVIDVKSTDGMVEINLLKDDEITNKLLINMINCLKELEKQYNKNIKIEEE